MIELAIFAVLGMAVLCWDLWDGKKDRQLTIERQAEEIHRLRQQLRRASQDAANAKSRENCRQWQQEERHDEREQMLETEIRQLRLQLRTKNALLQQVTR